MRKLICLMLFILVSLTWGTTWLAMKEAVNTIPPIFATGIRFLVSAPLLLCIAWLTKSPLLFPKGQRFFQAMVCFFYFSIPFSLMIYGETYVSSGLAAIIFSNMPAMVLIASVVFLNEKISSHQLVGLAIAIISLTCILIEESHAVKISHWQGIVALLAAAIMHANMYVQCKKRSCTVSVVTFNALPCLFAGLILSIFGWYIERPDVYNFSAKSILCVSYLGVFAGVFGILCYFLLQQRTSAFKASLVFLIFPLIAVSLESYTYGYTISILSMILVLPLAMGILLTLIPSVKITKNQPIVDRAS